MTGASIEATLELWASSLREVKTRMRPLFSQERVATSANSFLDGLLGDERRKTGWMRAEAAGDAGPWRQQAILGRGRSDADALRDVDRALYLPKSWTTDPARLASAHVPEGTAFATKPALAVEMIKRAIGANMPFAWVAADAVYGVGDIEQALRRAGKGYVLGVKGDHGFGSWGDKLVVAGTAAQIANALDPAAWRRLSAGQGTKGERFHDWTYFELADLDADEYAEGATGTWTRGLLIRRHVADGDLAFFTTWCPANTTIETLVGVEGHRWAIEDSFETAKNELGLDHNETRSWHGWHRHVSLVMLAFGMLAVIRTRANATPPKRVRTRLST